MWMGAQSTVLASWLVIPPNHWRVVTVPYMVAGCMWNVVSQSVCVCVLDGDVCVIVVVGQHCICAGERLAGSGRYAVVAAVAAHSV